MAELFEDWNYLARRDGVRAILPVVGLDIARLPYRHRKFMVLALSLLEPLPDLSAKIDFDIRIFEQMDLSSVRKIDRPSEARLCERRLAHGDKGFVAYYQGSLIGYAWGCTEIDPNIERIRIKLAPGDVLFNDAFTCPAYRGRGVQTALTLTRARVFKNLGYRRALSYIDTHNPSSLSVWQKKLRSQDLAYVDFLRIGPLYRVRITETNNWDPASVLVY